MGLHFWSRSIAAMLVLASLPTTGCSWLAVSKPPKGPIQATSPLECTSGVASPVVDTILAVGLVVGGVVAVSQPAKRGEWVPSNAMSTGAGLVLFAVAVPYTLSAGYGYSTTAKCRQLKETQLSCVSCVEDACRSLEEGKPQSPRQVPPVSGDTRALEQ